MNNGLVPILAYNYGAGNRERFVDSLKCGIKYAVAIMFAGLVIFQAAPEFLLGLFDASEAMLEIGVPALRTISYGFVLAGPINRFWYCMRNGLSGAGKRYLQHDGLHCTTAGGAASGGISAVPDGQGAERMVVISDCGTGVNAHHGSFPCEDL